MSSPLFKVSMQGEESSPEEQGQASGKGARCPLSVCPHPLGHHAGHGGQGKIGPPPMATTLAFPAMDLEYADDTALVAVTTAIANRRIQCTEEEAAKCGLHPNNKKRPG